MAIYHLTAKVVSRARGQSAVAAAAYRSGTALRDARYGVTHRYPEVRPVAHAEIMVPVHAPAWAQNREMLWNRVEADERRKDAQLARVVEVSLPTEMTLEENLALVREFVASEFVSQGMVADLSIRGEAAAQSAQVMLTLRPLTLAGFAAKERRWNGKAVLNRWRAAWADRTNEHLARAGHYSRIDHRTLEAQNIELTPARNLGVPRTALREDALPAHLLGRIAEQQLVAAGNGAAILKDPALALRALTHHQAIFKLADLERFLRTRTRDAAQFEAVYAAVRGCPDLVALDAASGDTGRFTSRDTLEAERSLVRRIAALSSRRALPPRPSPGLLPDLGDQGTRGRELEYLLGAGDAKALILAANPEKQALLRMAAAAWTRSGYRLQAAALSFRDVEALTLATGAACEILTAREDAWIRGTDLPSRDSVILVDGAEMIGLKQLERLAAVADTARCKLVLLGHEAQIRAMRVESPFVVVHRQAGLPAGDLRTGVV